MFNTKDVVEHVADPVSCSRRNPTIENHNCYRGQILLPRNPGFRKAKEGKGKECNNTSATEFDIFIVSDRVEDQVRQEWGGSKAQKRNECHHAIFERTVLGIRGKEALLHCQLLISHDVLVTRKYVDHLHKLPTGIWFN